MGNVIAMFRDSLTNLVSRMGTDRDKAAHTSYGYVVQNDEQILAAYRGAWLPRKIVDIPALDSCRKWRNWQGDESQIELIEAEENRLNLRGKVLEARIKARLLGGSGILIGTGEQDLSQPLQLERIGKGGVRYLTVFSRRQLSVVETDRDPASEFYGKPAMYRLDGRNGTSVDVHPTRLAIFIGNAFADEDVLDQTQGWGDSVLVAVFDAIKNADATAANIASLVFEAKIDVIRIPNFMSNLADEGYKRKILERYTLANTGKGINGTLMLDKEEEYETKTTSFATLPDVLDRFLQIVSGAADIPATRLLGQSPAGLNSTGEADLRNYYDRVSAGQEIEMTPALFRLDEALIRSATGARDPGVHYVWAPLWQMTDKERADIFKTKADAARTIAGTGGMSPALMPIDALSDALVNTLIEDGSMPGLEAAIEEWGRLGEQEEDEGEEAAAMLPAPANTNDPAMERAQRLAANDAAPRTLYVHRKVKNGAAIIAWAKEQGFTTTLEASDLHVTIAFSRQSVDWMKVGESWEDEIRISAGGPRVMEQFGEATVLLIPSRSLKWRHQEIKEAGASWDHEEYQPHITISYGGAPADLSTVKPYQGEIVLGPEVFEELDLDWKEKIKET